MYFKNRNYIKEYILIMKKKIINNVSALIFCTKKKYVKIQRRNIKSWMLNEFFFNILQYNFLLKFVKKFQQQITLI